MSIYYTSTNRVSVNKSSLIMMSVGLFIAFTYISFYFHSVIDATTRSKYVIYIACLFFSLISFLFKNRNGRSFEICDAIWIFMLVVIARNDLERSIFYCIAVLNMVLMRNCAISNLRALYIILIVFTIYYTVGVLFSWLMPSLYHQTFYKAFFPYYRMIIDSWNLPTGFAYQSGQTTGFLVIGIGGVIYLKKNTKAWIKAVYVSVIILCILLNSKRAHLLFLLLSLIGVEYFLQKRSNKQLTYALGVILAAICAWIIMSISRMYIGDSVAISRIIDTINDFFIGKDISNGRSGYYQIALQFFYRNPLFGIGWGQYSVSSQQIMYGVAQNVHNCYLQLLCETGIIGTIIILIPMFITLYRTIAIIKRLDDPQELSWCKFSLYIQLFTLMYFSTGNPLYDLQYYAWYFIAIGIFNCIESRQKSERKALIYA